MARELNLDRLYNAVPEDVGKRAFRFITRFDPDYREACAAGLALTLLRVCEHWEVDPREFMKVAERIHQKTVQEQPQLRAVDQFITEELS